MSDETHRRENDHLVEPLYDALPERAAPPSNLLRRSGLWCVALVVTALLLKYFG